MFLKGLAAAILGMAAIAGPSGAGEEPQRAVDGLKSEDMEILDKAVAEMLAERKEQIRVALTELEELFAKPRYQREHVARAEVLVGFLGEMRAAEGASLLASEVAYPSARALRPHGSMLAEMRFPAYKALLKIGSAGKEGLLEALMCPERRDFELSLLADVLAKTWGGAGALALVEAEAEGPNAETVSEIIRRRWLPPEPEGYSGDSYHQ